MTDQFNIVEFIENNPITKLNKTYESKLIEKIKQKFTFNQQNLFVTSFYGYLNYDQTSAFVIDLREIWQWLGFSRIEECKRVLTKHFNENVDYKISSYDVREAINDPQLGGTDAIHHKSGWKEKQKILMNIKTFKKLCIKSNTKKADEVHEYFVELENLIFETMTEETSELRHQLIQNSKETAVKIRSKEEKLIDQFPEDKMCIYIADIGFIDGVHLVKFGESNNLKQRVISHRNTFENFELVSAYEVFNSRKFEKMLKEVPEIKYRLKHTVVKDQNRHEIMFVDERYTLEDLNKEIKSLIEKHCTLENCLADIELRKAEIELRKIELQEKTKQMELEIRLLELKSTGNTHLHIKEKQVTTPVTNPVTSPVNCHLLVKHEFSKIYLLEIMKKYEQYEPYSVKCNGFGNYNGYSKEYKIKIERMINLDFGSNPIKTMGKIYYLNLKFSGSTSFHCNEIYESFINSYIEQYPEDIRYTKIPPGLFKYKTESDLLFKKFCDHVCNYVPLFDNKCPSGFTQLYKKEFIEMVTLICGINPPSYSNKTVKYFNGITLKLN